MLLVDFRFIVIMGVNVVAFDELLKEAFLFPIFALFIISLNIRFLQMNIMNINMPETKTYVNGTE